MNTRPEDNWVNPRHEAEIIDAKVQDPGMPGAGAGTPGVVAAAPGVIVHRKPLTVVISFDGDPASAAPLATVMVDELIGAGDLTFGPVAEALQAFVVAHQPTGVAALLDVAPDPIAFLFDQAVAIEPGTVHRGEGRSGWNTVFVGGDVVTLLAGTDNIDDAEVQPGWSRLAAGTVAGAGARTTLALIDLTAEPEPQPSEVTPPLPEPEVTPQDQFVSLPPLVSTQPDEALSPAAITTAYSDPPEDFAEAPLREAVEPRLAEHNSDDVEPDEPADLDLTTIIVEPLTEDHTDSRFDADTEMILLDETPTTVMAQGPAMEALATATPTAPPASLEPEPWSQPGQPPLPEVNLDPAEPLADPPPMPPVESLDSAPGRPGSPGADPGAEILPPAPDQVSLADLPPPPPTAVPSIGPPPPMPGSIPLQSAPPTPGIPPMPDEATATPEPISALPPWPDVPPLPKTAKSDPESHSAEPASASPSDEQSPSPSDESQSPALEDLSKLPPPPADAQPSP